MCTKIFLPNVCREFVMETTRKSVYPVHKLEKGLVPVVDDDDEVVVESNDIDFQINKHYFDVPNQNKYSVQKQFKPLAMPHEKQRGTM